MSEYGADCCLMHAGFGEVSTHPPVSYSVSLIVGYLCVPGDFDHGVCMQVSVRFLLISQLVIFCH